MPWVRIDDKFDDSEDIDQMSVEAIALHLCGTTWSARNLTDGFVPAARVKKLPGGGDGVPTCLLAGEKPWWLAVDGGYQIRSYLKYNPSAEQVKAEREATKNRVTKHRASRPVTPDVTPLQTDAVHPPPVSRIPYSDTHIPTPEENPDIGNTNNAPAHEGGVAAKGPREFVLEPEEGTHGVDAALRKLTGRLRLAQGGA